MGHSDEIAIVDANFPATACATRLVRLDSVDADYSGMITSIERLAINHCAKPTVRNGPDGESGLVWWTPKLACCLACACDV